MDKSMKVIVIGIILLVAGIVGSLASFFLTLKDPSEEAVDTVYFTYPDYTETVYLESGRYDVWFESEFISWGDPGDVTIRDSGGSLVWTRSWLTTTGSISVNNVDYKRAGSFSASSTGNYNVTVDTESTLYFTPPIDVETGVLLCFSGVGIGIAGGVLLLVGIILLLTKEKKPPVPYPQYPQQYPPQQQYPPPQYPPQQPPPSQPPPQP